MSCIDLHKLISNFPKLTNRVADLVHDITHVNRIAAPLKLVTTLAIRLFLILGQDQDVGQYVELALTEVEEILVCCRQSCDRLIPQRGSKGQ